MSCSKRHNNEQCMCTNSLRGYGASRGRERRRYPSGYVAELDQRHRRQTHQLGNPNCSSLSKIPRALSHCERKCEPLLQDPPVLQQPHACTNKLTHKQTSEYLRLIGLRERERETRCLGCRRWQEQTFHGETICLWRVTTWQWMRNGRWPRIWKSEVSGRKKKKQESEGFEVDLCTSEKPCPAFLVQTEKREISLCFSYLLLNQTCRVWQVRFDFD